MRFLMRLPGIKSSRRRLVLLLTGLAWVAYGIGVLTDPFPEARFGRVITFLSPLLDSPHTGWLWLLCGVAGIFAALSLMPQPAAFRLLVIPPVVWATLYLWSWVTWVLIRVDGGGRGWVSATAWCALALMISVTAGWSDVDDGERQ